MDLRKLAAQFAADNHQANISNGNVGSDGTNRIYDMAHGDRGKQMNPTWISQHRRPGAPDEEEGEGDVYGNTGCSD